MKLKEITGVLEHFAPLSLQESYDNSGLLTGNPEMEIKAALLSVDCTEEVVQEAISKGCNLIIAHHPIVFSGIKKLTGRNYVERTLIAAIKHDIAIYAAHTNMDNVLTGVNHMLAEKLGLINRRILSPKSQTLKKLVTYVPSDQLEKVAESLFQMGAGKIGKYDQCSFRSDGTGTFRPLEGSDPFSGTQGVRSYEKESRLEVIFPAFRLQEILKGLKTAHPYEEVAFETFTIDQPFPETGSGLVGELEKPIPALEYLQEIKQKLNLNTLKYTMLVKKEVRRVALCGGSGAFLIKQAAAAGADLYISGDIKYHEYFDAEKDLIIADIGHYESEQWTPRLFFNLLSEKFPNFAFLVAETNTNPIKYL